MFGLCSEGDRARAAAAVERELGSAARRSIDRQGRLLMLYVVADQSKVFGVGMLVGLALAFGFAVFVQHNQNKDAE